MKELIYKDLTFKIRRCLMNVYNQLGPGFREETYPERRNPGRTASGSRSVTSWDCTIRDKKALIKEFRNNNIPFNSEKPIPIKYNGEVIDEYRIDLIAFDKIILELKAVAKMHPMYEAQLLSYLKAAELKLGLLVNFGTDKLFIKRLVNPHL